MRRREWLGGVCALILIGCATEDDGRPSEIRAAPPLAGSEDGPIGKTPDTAPSVAPDDPDSGPTTPVTEVGPLNQALRPLVDEFEDEIDLTIDKIRAMRATGKADNKVFITLLDNYETNAERLLQAMDALNVPPAAEPGVEAIKDFYHGYGDFANALKEAYFEEDGRDVSGKEAQAEEFARRKGRDQLEKTLNGLGYDGGRFRQSRVLAKKGGRPY